jgi:hypothetical protein
MGFLLFQENLNNDIIVFCFVFVCLFVVVFFSKTSKDKICSLNRSAVLKDGSSDMHANVEQHTCTPS